MTKEGRGFLAALSLRRSSSQPQPYSLPPTPTTGETVSFAELSECARLLRQTAIGVVLKGGEVCNLAPGMHEAIQFKEGDKVIVIAEE